jgi:hypothetical protein
MVVTGKGEEAWYDFLLRHAKLVVGIQREVVQGWRLSGGMVAVLADFGNEMGMTRSPRDVRRVDIEMIPELREEECAGEGCGAGCHGGGSRCVRGESVEGCETEADPTVAGEGVYGGGKFLGMRDEGLIWGPSPEVPFQRASVTSVFDIPKEKDNPESDRIRPIYHFGVENGGASVNDLCAGPEWLRFNPQGTPGTRWRGWARGRRWRWWVCQGSLR